MDEAQDKNGDTSSLSALGITQAEEQAYRCLLARTKATMQEIARDLSVSPFKAQQLLDGIETKGLVSRTAKRPHQYLPSSPDIALGALFHQRQKALLETQSAIQNLQEQADFVKRGEDQERMVELITSREAEQQIYRQIMTDAQVEVVALIRPPVRVSNLENADEQFGDEREKPEVGDVRYRGIVDTQFLELPGSMDYTQYGIDAGEEVRVVSQLPFKLIASDHRIALIPLDLERPEGPSLLVRSSALLDALYALFETLWERAEPVPTGSMSQTQSVEASANASQDTWNADELIFMLAAGLSDKAIAYEKGVSLRTHRRRVNALLGTLEARTRFQAGWLAAKADTRSGDK